MSPTLHHLYIHVPFCKGVCSYCAFYKERFTPAAVRQWLVALEREMQIMAAAHPFDLHTIYLGGGTPSVLAPQEIVRLCTALRHTFAIGASVEWTLEANPESIDSEKIAIWQQAGVNRLSLGVQSLNPLTLQSMQRLHDVEMVHQAVAIVRQYPHIAYGMDLIAGYPGVSDDAWLDTLEGVLALQPTHISLYECTLHRDTCLWSQIQKGELREVPEHRRNRALAVATRCLSAAGYEQYETSNFSKPGQRCRHNVAVWRGEDYLGLGPGASSRVGLQRWTNAPDLPAYIQSADSGEFPRDEEKRTPAQDATERLMFAFRLRDSVDLDDFTPADAALAADMRTHWEQQLANLREEGLVCKQGRNWRTSAKGRCMADCIAEALLF